MAKFLIAAYKFPRCRSLLWRSVRGQAYEDANTAQLDARFFTHKIGGHMVLSDCLTGRAVGRGRTVAAAANAFARKLISHGFHEFYWKQSQHPWVPERYRRYANFRNS